MLTISSEEANRIRNKTRLGGRCKECGAITACEVRPLMVRNGQDGHYTISMHQWGDSVFKEEPEPTKSGYHNSNIPQGKYGEASKVLEEAHELIDAHEQGVKIMALVEVSDLVNAIEAYLRKHHPGVDIDDAIKMGRKTEQVFKNGGRKAKD